MGCILALNKNLEYINVELGELGDYIKGGCTFTSMHNKWLTFNYSHNIPLSLLDKYDFYYIPMYNAYGVKVK